MSDETKIIQKAALGSDTTQIGEQNNYYGMTAEEASNLAIKSVSYTHLTLPTIRLV